jgi:hypothetical protein
MVLASAATVFGRDPDGQFERVLEVGSSVELEVATDSGGIIVRNGRDGEIRVVGRIYLSNRWRRTEGMDKVRRLEQNPPIDRQGDHVRIGEMLSGYDFKHVSIGYEIWTPRNTQLRSTCDSGGQEIEGISGPVVASTDSGGIRIRDIGGSVTLDVDSGRIEADGIDGDFIAHADSGGIQATAIRGRVDVEADSGGIRIEQIAAADLRAAADSGGVRVTIPSGAGYDVNAVADSGGISVGPPITVRGTIKKNEIHGRIGEGGHSLDISTDSGGIEIHEGASEL